MNQIGQHITDTVFLGNGEHFKSRALIELLREKDREINALRAILDQLGVEVTPHPAGWAWKRRDQA